MQQTFIIIIIITLLQFLSKFMLNNNFYNFKNRLIFS